MALTKLTTDVENIQKLSDTPNSTDGLSANMLKNQFDKAGRDIKSYINETLTSEIDSNFALKEELSSVVLGDIPDNTVTEEKLSNSLQSKIEAILDVDNDITKALLYPDLITSDYLAELSQQQTYKDSQISKLINIVNDLSSQVATLRYDSIISGNNSKGSVKSVNKTFSTAPKLVTRTGTITQSIWNNTIRVQCINNQNGTVEYSFGQGGIWVDKIHIKPYHLNNYQTTQGILKVYYTTDGETWQQLNVANQEVYKDYTTSVASNYNPEIGTWQIGYVYSYSVGQPQNNGAGTDMSWVLPLNEMKFIKGIKVELAQTNNVNNTTEWCITPVLSIDNTISCFNTKLNNNIVSRTGVFTGATGSTAVEGSGSIQFTNKIPKNSYVTLKFRSTAESGYSSTGSSYLNASTAKRMYIRGSNNGTTWDYLCYFSGRVSNYSYTYGYERGFGGVEGTFMQGMNDSNFFITVPGGYKYYDLYCPQTNVTIPPSMTARQIINSYNGYDTYNGVNATVYNSRNFLPMTDIILDGFSIAIGEPIVIESEMSASDSAIEKAFFISNRTLGINEQVKVKVGTINASNTDIDGDETIISNVGATITDNGDSIVVQSQLQTITNDSSGKDIKFTYTDQNASLGTQTVNSLVGGYL